MNYKLNTSMPLYRAEKTILPTNRVAFIILCMIAKNQKERIENM